MIMPILCSISATVMPWRTSLRISSARPSVSSGLTPPAGSSSSISLGSVARASAKATRLRSSCVMSPAMRPATCDRPTKSSASRVFSRHTRSSSRRRLEPRSTSHRPERVRSRWPTMRLSSTVARSNSAVVWKVRATPSFATWSVRSEVTSWPLKVMVPEVGLCTQLIRLKNVVLPAPLGPMMALMRPSSITVLTSLTAASPPKVLVRWSILSMRLALLGIAARAPCGEAAHHAVGHEDHQHHENRAEDDEAVLLQELQVLRDPGHADGAQQRPQHRAHAADHGEDHHVEGVVHAGHVGTDEDRKSVV